MSKKEITDSPSSKDIIKASLKKTEEYHYVGVTNKSVVISTSSLILDNLVKVRSGQVVRLLAKTGELGKTSQALLNTQPKLLQIDLSLH